MLAIFVFLMFAFAIAAIVGTIWAAIEIGTKPFVKENDKVLWLIIVLLLGGIGPLIYFTQRKKLLAEFNAPSPYDTLDINAPRAEPEARSQGKGWDDDYV